MVIGINFSNLNNLEVITTTSNKYETAFGFTQQEVVAAMDKFGLQQKNEAKYWYDGFDSVFLAMNYTYSSI